MPANPKYSRQVLCPMCGSRMVLRTARRGRNAGRQFYGCFRYPNCTGTRDIAEESAFDPQTSDPDPTLRSRPQTTGTEYSRSAGPVSTHRTRVSEDGPRVSRTDNPRPSQHPSRLWDVPRHVILDRQSETTQVMVFQSNQQLPSIVQAIYDTQLDKQTVGLSSQWLLDLPDSSGTNKLTDEDKTLLSVAENVLIRGTCSYTSPAIERFISTQCSGFQTDRIAPYKLKTSLQWLSANPTCPYTPVSFDSIDEEQFAKLFKSNEMTKSWCMLEQVHFSSLLRGLGDGDERRFDFLLTHPDGASVIVEIDGKQHESFGDADRRRDTLLAGAGFSVFRIPVQEVDESGGPRLTALWNRLKGTPPPAGNCDAGIELAFRLAKLTHQVQVTILQAVMSGILPLNGSWVVRLEPPNPDRLDPGLALEAARIAVEECHKLIEKLFVLYGRNIERPNIQVEFAQDVTTGGSGITLALNRDRRNSSGIPVFTISDICFPAMVAAPHRTALPLRPQAPDLDSASWFLRYIFRKPDFWKGQWEIMDRALRGVDTIALLPTGGGKSIAFQLSAMLLPGRCIVVEPIVALIEDQVDNVQKVGIDRCLGLSSSVERQMRSELEAVMATGQYLFTYVTPERFQIHDFRETLAGLTTQAPVSLFAIDEAHCVSEWGHDFRPAYLNLGANARRYCSTNSYDPPPIIALTGTAGRIVLRDLQRDLGVQSLDATITPKSLKRSELQFAVIKSHSQYKIARLTGLVNWLPSAFGINVSRFFTKHAKDTYAGIIFAPTVNGPDGVFDLANNLRYKFPVPTGYYSGSKPRYDSSSSWNETKRKTAQGFKHDEIRMLFATKSFGMGIDKENVRYVIHYGLPGSIESFYQEAGRAGRDKSKAICGLVFSNDDPGRSRSLLNPETGISEIQSFINSTRRDDQDDVMQALWFHVQAFRGAQVDIHYVEKAIVQLEAQGGIGIQKRALITFPSDENERSGIEKAIYRLSILGIIGDYAIDWSRGHFDVQLQNVDHETIIGKFHDYVRHYQEARDWKLSFLDQNETVNIKDFALHAGKALVAFVYDVIEKSRRRALQEMLIAAEETSNGSGDIQTAIVRHLEWSQFDEALDGVIDSSQGGLDHVGLVLDMVVSVADASALRGSVARLLESYPDQPGLLMLRAAVEYLWDASGTESSVNGALDLKNSLTFASTKYKIDPKVAARACAALINAPLLEERTAIEVISIIVDHKAMSRDIATTLYPLVDLALKPPILAWLIEWSSNELVSSATQLNEELNAKRQL